MRTLLIVVAAALLACLVLIGSRSDEPVAGLAPTPSGPSFQVRVVFPRLGRPFFGLLPEPLVAKVGGIPAELAFDHASPGAKPGTVGRHRLELRADGWDLSLQTDGKGRIAAGSHLVFPLFFEEEMRRLRCRPAGRDSGYLRTATRSGGGELGGDFRVELSTCEDAGTGRAIGWPPAPLIVVGSFDRLPRGA